MGETPIATVGRFDLSLLCEGESSLAMNKRGCGDNGGFRLPPLFLVQRKQRA